MARKLKLYIASSLNSRIASSDGSVSWLDSIPNPDNDDYGYKSFYDSIDSTIQGYATYSQVRSWDIPFPYKEKKNYVFTHRKELESESFVEFITENQIEFTQKLKEEEGKDIWLIGGGQINTLLLDAGLVDEIYIFIMPIILDGGIKVFESIPELKMLELISSKAFSSGAIELIYKVNNK